MFDESGRMALVGSLVHDDQIFHLGAGAIKYLEVLLSLGISAKRPHDFDFLQMTADETDGEKRRALLHSTIICHAKSKCPLYLREVEPGACSTASATKGEHIAYIVCLRW